MPDNTITIVGNTTREPELRFTASGQATASFSVAVNRKWQNRQTQEWEEQVSFFDCVAWQSLAENVCETIRKGDRIIVTGRLEQRSWKTQEGENRTKIELVADEVGPALRFATAVVTKTERSSGGTPRTRPAPTAAQGGDSYDDEPF